MTGILKKIPIIGSLVPTPPPPPTPTVTPPPVPEVPRSASVEARAAQVAAAEKRKRLRGQAGKRATILTSPLGAPLSATSVTRKTLLGG